MWDFLEKVVTIALPRTKDFRGIDRKALDNIGNLTLGIKEHTIFPETSDEDLKDVFGFAITIVTTSRDKKATLAFLEYIGLPLKKEEAGRGRNNSCFDQKENRWDESGGFL